MFLLLCCLRLPSTLLWNMQDFILAAYLRVQLMRRCLRYLDIIYGANSDRKLSTDHMAFPPADIVLWFVLVLLDPTVAVVAW